MMPAELFDAARVEGVSEMAHLFPCRSASGPTNDGGAVDHPLPLQLEQLSVAAADLQ